MKSFMCFHILSLDMRNIEKMTLVSETGGMICGEVRMQQHSYKYKI